MHRLQLLLVFILAVLGSTAIAHAQMDPKWSRSIHYLNTAYEDLPADPLDRATQYLDSTVLTSQCYKFIPSPDSTKFIAFYLARKDAPDFKALRKEFGGASHHIDLFSFSDPQVDVLAYTVCGLKYNNNWYFCKGDYYEFTAPGEEEARTKFLVQILEEKDFFAGRDKENKKFWAKNGFEKCTSPVKVQTEEQPALVKSACQEKKKRQENILNTAIEQTALHCYTSLWSALHQNDSVTFRTPLYTDGCISWYNPQRNLVLLPVLFYDGRNKPWVSYFVLKLSGNARHIYLWNRIPRKPIDWPRGNEVQQVVYDIRSYLPNWTWGTSNMIADAQFWSDNFREEDLRLLASE